MTDIKSQGTAMNENKIRILVVDDHPLLLAGLSLLLNAEEDLHVVGQANSADQALEVAAASQPDIILLDISLQDHSGLAIIRQLLDKVPGTRIIMLTMHENRQYLQKAMSQGAKGFVLKKGVDADLIYAVRSVMRGEVYVQPSLLKGYLPKGPDSLRSESGKPLDAEILLWESLSNREQEILTMVAKGHSSREIANQCLLSEKTVATYRSRGLAKLDLKSRSELVELALKLGKLQ